ncbi:MAG: carbohydrate kinase family protein [Candidatus Acidiferrum sp.]|jgi:sugar/nucleoside kinase (ribokinase family)
MTNQEKFGISVVGELNLDLVLYGLPGHFELDREHLASSLSLTLGSSSAIFAHNCALLGNRVGFHAAVGDDPLGELCLGRLMESGVDVSAVRKFPGKQTGISVILPQPEKRFILTYAGVMAELRLEDLDLKRILNASHLHLSSYFLQRALRPRVPDLFRLAKEAGLSTSLDTNDDPDDGWERDFLDVLAWVDVLLPNEYEACRLARIDDPMLALDFLAERVPLVVMKRGEKGALARRGAETFEASSLSVVAVDAIGAGDSFDAGFLHQFIRGAKIEECLRYGNLAGALSTTRSGGTEAFRDTQHRQSFLAQ